MEHLKETIIEAIIKCLPYSDQIKDLDFTSNENAIYFTWRSTMFKVSKTGHVEEVDGSILIGSDICIIFSELLQRQLLTFTI